MKEKKYILTKANQNGEKLCDLIGQKWQNSFQTHTENFFVNEVCQAIQLILETLIGI